MMCAAVLSAMGLHAALGQMDTTPDTGQAPIVRYDMAYLFDLDLADPAQRRRFWDETHLIAALQGLANRDGPRLYLRYNPGPDDFWWAEMCREGGWLAGREVVEVTSLYELLGRFEGSFDGAVVWDERVPATSNLASTLAGVEGLLPIRHDPAPGSLCQELALPARIILMAEDGSPLFTGQGLVPGTETPSTGSAKCDAYLWLIEHAVRPGRVNPHRMGYYLDAFWLQCWQAGAPQNHTLTNHDYVIANKGVLFDLGVWDDEAAVDDPGQAPGTDEATLRALLRAMYDQFGGDGVIHVAGFVPWAYKYTNVSSSVWSAGGTHDAVPTEWRYAEILSCYNAFMDADALGMSSMANASFYQHYPLPERIEQSEPTAESLIEKGVLDADGHIIPRRYYAHYVGDYDSAAWLYWMLPSLYTDENRGRIPLSWAFNPNLAERFPVGMMWARRLATPNDAFVAGDVGAGYLNPGSLSEPRPYSGLTSGVAAWEEHCRRFFEQWDLSVTGFIIDGYARGLTEEGLDAYARFSPGGIVAQKIPAQGVHEGMPFIRMGGDLPHNAAEAAQVIRTRFRGHPPQFAVYRSILMPPSWYVAVDEAIQAMPGDEVMCTDLPTLLWLVREREEHPDRYAAPPSAYAAAARIAANGGSEEGLGPVAAADGPVRLAAVADPPAWEIAGHEPVQYLYFDADDGFLPAGPETLVLEVVFMTEDGQPPHVQYDSSDALAPVGGAYRLAELREVNDEGAGWGRAVYHAPAAAFSGGQNSQADLRVVGRAGPVWVQAVVARRAN